MPFYGADRVADTLWPSCCHSDGVESWLCLLPTLPLIPSVFSSGKRAANSHSPWACCKGQLGDSRGGMDIQ